jgi:diadenosine tetraphosphate (Ap4A) HIT family hydrolase
MISYATLKAAQEGKVAPWTNTVPELSNTHIAVFRDAYPVAQGHLLFVPYANTDESIVVAMGMALLVGRQMVQNNQCDAFNVGLNAGVAAGQTVMYPHVHLIPRLHGDTPDPVGGVRGVIPGQANYKTDMYQQPE